MSKKNVVRLHPSTAVYLFEKVYNFMIGKKIDRDHSKEIVGKVTIKPPKKNHPSELGKITFTIKSSSHEEDQRA